MTQQEHLHWQPRLVALATEAAGSDGAHDINHLHRVWRNAQQLMQDFTPEPTQDSTPECAQEAHATLPDALVVMTACYLHDLVNLPKNHPQRSMASRQSAQLAAVKLLALDFPAARLAGALHAIETHSFSADIAPQTIEAQIVQDADRLDALGAVGLARLFYIAGQMGSALAHPDDPLARGRARDDRAYALDHIELKLAKLPAMMQTAAGRRLGAQRLAQLLQFRDSFAAEW